MSKKDFTISCPQPLKDFDSVQLSHGGGGKIMNELLDNLILPTFSNPHTKERHDSTVINIGNSRIAFTTDSYVIDPIFFPGGDIGSLSVHGTVNDLAMSGAKPLYISVGLIIEEGFPMESFSKIIKSMQQTAAECNVEIVTGDTKVVDKGKGDGIFINTAGLGILDHNLNISPSNIKPNDAIIINGDIGRHGIATLSSRENFSFQTTLKSDSADLSSLVSKLIKERIDIHCMRDLTRGGLGSALVELANASGIGMNIDEQKIPIAREVKGVCEILGFDPIYIANEGRFVCFVSNKDRDKALEIMRSQPIGKNACAIGNTTGRDSKFVVTKSEIGSERIIDLLSGEQLPRIC